MSGIDSHQRDLDAIPAVLCERAKKDSAAALKTMEACRKTIVDNAEQIEELMRQHAPQKLYEEFRRRWFNDVMASSGMPGFRTYTNENLKNDLDQLAEILQPKKTIQRIKK
jgi:uncharacterized protein (UPF0371 family)